MPRKPKKGYFVRGQFVAEGSELDLELKAELTGGMTSLKEIIDNNGAVDKMPELFCFGLLDHFDILQLKALARVE